MKQERELEALHTLWKDIKSHDSDNKSSRNVNLTTYDAQIKALQEDLIHKSDAYFTLQQQIQPLKQHNQQLVEQIEALNHENKALFTKLCFVESSLNEIDNQDGTSRSEYEKENNLLRDEIDHLLNLLQNTQEYQDLNLNQKVYLKGANKYLRRASQQQKIRLNAESSTGPEELLWVPSDAFNLVNAYFDAEGTVGILTSINKSFYDIYHPKLKQLKQQYNEEFKNWKRQYQSKIPYDEMCAQKTISRLKNQLVKGKQDQGNDQQINQFIAQIQQYQGMVQEQDQRLRAQDKEIRELKKQNENGSSYRKQLFMEGAQWMCKIIQEQSILVDRIMKDIRTYEQEVIYLNCEFDQKISSLMDEYDIVQQQIISKVSHNSFYLVFQFYEWIKESQLELLSNFKDKLNSIQSSTSSKLSQSH